MTLIPNDKESLLLEILRDTQGLRKTAFALGVNALAFWFWRLHFGVPVADQVAHPIMHGIDLAICVAMSIWSVDVAVRRLQWKQEGAK